MEKFYRDWSRSYWDFGIRTDKRYDKKQELRFNKDHFEILKILRSISNTRLILKIIKI